MESISRISSILDTSHSLTLDAARAATRAKPPPKTTPSPALIANLKKQLDSKHEREVLDGLRRVITLSHRSSSSTGPLLLPHVLKNIASPSLAVKKLVYIHLLYSAEADPDTALLAVNAIQKSLSAPDARLRALALRVMSGLRVPVISQIVALGIKRGVSDPSPLVRRAAALAIPKCWRLDQSTVPQLTEYLEQLLGDRQYYVAGAAVIAMGEVCPERVDLLHKQYRELVRKLVDMDEWAQLATLRLLVVYARKCFPQRTRRVRRKEATSTTNTVDDFYNSQAHEPSPQEDTSDNTLYTTTPVIDHDLEALLRATSNLLYSRSSAVIVAAARTFAALAPPSSPYLASAVGPLVALLRTPPAIQEVALYSIVQVARLIPTAFTKYTTRFLVHTADPPQIQILKLDALALLFPHCPPHLQSLILNELVHFCASDSPALVRESVRAIGRCAQSSDPNSATATRCVRILLQQISSNNANASLVAESLTVLRLLIQADPTRHTRTVVQLAKNLDTMASGEARASVIWLVGEMAGLDDGDNIAADVLRILVKGFADESEVAKMQIVLLGAKVYLHYLNRTQATSEKTAVDQQDTNQANESTEETPTQPHQIELLWQHILVLARYDTSYDLRDRTRVYKTLLSVPSATQLANLMLLAPKPVPHAPSPSEARKDYTLGSASLVVGREGVGPSGLQGYTDLPEWVADGQEPDPRLREDDSIAAPRAGGSASERLSAMVGSDAALQRAVAGRVNGGQSQRGEKSLDDWLAETDEEEEEESEDESGDEDEESEEETDETGEESEDETEEEESESEAGEDEALVKQKQ